MVWRLEKLLCASYSCSSFFPVSTLAQISLLSSHAIQFKLVFSSAATSLLKSRFTEALRSIDATVPETALYHVCLCISMPFMVCCFLCCMCSADFEWLCLDPPLYLFEIVLIAHRFTLIETASVVHARTGSQSLWRLFRQRGTIYLSTTEK